MQILQSVPSEPTERIKSLRHKTMSAERYLSVDQAKIITRVYKENESLHVSLKRAEMLAKSLIEMPINIDPEELIVGNRTPGIRSGVVFPEAGVSWVANELETLPCRGQDPFSVHPEDAAFFTTDILPFWKGRTLEDDIYRNYGAEIRAIEKTVKINQKDHAQGHICPKVEDWLKYGPSGLLKTAREKLKNSSEPKKVFYNSVCITLNAACKFIKRYAALAENMSKAEEDEDLKENLLRISATCNYLSANAPADLHQAVQSVWFLFVILHMESNASSFSPGRMDQYLYPYYKICSPETDPAEIVELFDALFIKFNQIVYMRNEHSARYFAGFPIGFNVTIGGQTINGGDATNELSYIILKSQEHVRLPQPNLTARLHKNSTDDFINECSRIIGLGIGMPQIANDESIIPALKASGISNDDAIDYVLVGCVELSTQGNYLGWSDAAMFNLVKVLELTLNDGKCMLTGEQTGLKTGDLTDFKEFSDLECAFAYQIDFFIEKMTKLCEAVERAHQDHLPSPFLSCVTDNCLEKGIDVTTGGAKYNMSGIQAIQVANIADSLMAIKKLIYDEKIVQRESFHKTLLNNFEGEEPIRQICINHVPKYGNDEFQVDEMGSKWIKYFAQKLKSYRNYRGGEYQMGLYTVSAHVPMGDNVGATPDGRKARSPLADGGLSPMYGRDKTGPTAVLNSVARIPSVLAGNGALLNMKFLPSVFRDGNDRTKFSSFLKSFVKLPVHHVQFNVVTADELIKAKADPQSFRGLTIRVAGYTAFFTELAENLQDEIIRRTTHGE
jgi:pyruvate formate-lyase/glycerol dehydratase family glycyl radical enzyme